MATKLIILVGISGSGKSTFAKSFSDATVISADDVRRELTGNVSDQSKNKEVFDICYSRLDKALDDTTHDIIIWDNMNLSIRDLNSVMEHLEFYKVDVDMCVMMSSFDWKECNRRVHRDILNGVDRSNTDILVNGEPLQELMYERFINVYPKLKSWCSENKVKYIELK